MRASFMRAFPTPGYLAPPALGIDISDEGIKYAELLRTKDGLRLGRFGERVFPPGVIEKGVIKKPEIVTEALRAVHAELALRVAFVSIMEGQGYFVRMKISADDPASIRSAVELQLEEFIPLNPAEAAFDCELVPAIRPEQTGEEVSVAALPRSAVEAYCEALFGGEFEPLALEIESQSIARAVVPRGDKGTFLLVDIGRLRTGVTIVSEGIVGFSSTVAIGGDNFTRLIQKELGVSYEEAEKMKKEQGIGAEGGPLFSGLVSLLSALKEEVGQHCAFWSSHPFETGTVRKKIEGMYLSGGAGNMAGLPEYLSSTLSMPVKLANPWVNVASFEDSIPAMPFAVSLGYVTAIGLALRAFEEGAYTVHL